MTNGRQEYAMICRLESWLELLWVVPLLWMQWWLGKLIPLYFNHIAFVKMNFKVQCDDDTCIHLVMFLNDWTAQFNLQRCTYIVLNFFLKFLCHGYRPISGASMNPARSLGPAIASSNYKSIWVYIVGPIIGAVAGALVYNLIRLPEQEAGKLQSKSSRSFRR